MDMSKASDKKLDGYLERGEINRELFDTITKIPNPNKKARVIKTLDRRIRARDGEPVE